VAAAKKAEGAESARREVGADVREADLDAAAREKLDSGTFGLPGKRMFPMPDENHARLAWSMLNRAKGLSDEEKAEARRRIKARCKHFGIDTGGDDDDGAESESESREATSSAWDRERPVRESTVQPASVRGAIVREGRGYRIRDCQIMAAGSGNALMGNTYLPEAVEALVREVQRQPKSYVDHSIPSEVQARGHRSLRDLAGVYDKRTVRYDPTSQACLADLIVRPSVYDEYVAPVLEAGDNLGISVDGIGHCPHRPRHVTGWKRFNSADLVPAGGARGFIVREANSPAEKAAEKEFAVAVLDDITATDVRETAPALYEEIGRQYATSHGGGAGAPAAVASPPSPPPDDGRLSALETRVREAEQRAEVADARVYELEAERNRAAVAAFVDATVRECGITEDKQAQFVAKRFAGATMGAEGTYHDQDTLEAAVREAAEEFKAVLPVTPTGQIVGLGSGAGTAGSKFTAPTQAQNKAILTAADWLFGAPSIPERPAVAPASNGQGG